LEEDKEHIELLKEWNLEPAPIDQVILFTPPGDHKLIGTEQELTLSTSDLTPDDLCSFWNTDVYSPQGHLIGTVMEKVGETGYDSVRAKSTGERVIQHIPSKDEYDVEDLILCLQTDQNISSNTNPQVVDAVLWRLQSLRRSRLFRPRGVLVQDFLKEGQVVVLLLRSLDDATKTLVAGVLLKKIYEVMGEYKAQSL
jgi:hypothetical protein